MLNRLFQAAMITFLLSLLMGGNSFKVSKKAPVSDNTSIHHTESPIVQAFVWNQNRVNP